MNLREKAIADGRITRWARTPDELDALGFHTAAAAARQYDRATRAAYIIRF